VYVYDQILIKSLTNGKKTDIKEMYTCISII